MTEANKKPDIISSVQSIELGADASTQIDKQVEVVKDLKAYKVMKNIGRMFHLLAAAYIIGQSFSVFIFGVGYDETNTGNASLILESIFVGVLAVSGLLNIWSIMKLSTDSKGRTRWLWAIFGKMVALIFYTRLLEALTLRIMG